MTFSLAFHRQDWRQWMRMQATSLSRHHRKERGNTGLTIEEE
jgi:hypothetical protein